MTDIIDSTDRSPMPTCWRCHRQGEPATFTTKVIYAWKFDSRGARTRQGTRFTVCLDTTCAEQLQAVSET